MPHHEAALLASDHVGLDTGEFRFPMHVPRAEGDVNNIVFIRQSRSEVANLLHDLLESVTRRAPLFNDAASAYSHV